MKLSINPEIYRLLVVKQGLKALLLGGKINTAYTSTACRNVVTSLTGKRYKAGKKGLTNALMDLEQIIQNKGL